MTRPRLVKLVRDRVGQFLPDGATGVEYRPIEDDRTYRLELRKKLVEEALEYLQEPSVGELADVYAVVYALAENDLGSGIGDVAVEAASKHKERGGFDQRIGMYVETSAPTRLEPVVALPPTDSPGGPDA